MSKPHEIVKTGMSLVAFPWRELTANGPHAQKALSTHG